jgi:hypothetical protein
MAKKKNSSSGSASTKKKGGKNKAVKDEGDAKPVVVPPTLAVPPSLEAEMAAAQALSPRRATTQAHHTAADDASSEEQPSAAVDSAAAGAAEEKEDGPFASGGSRLAASTSVPDAVVSFLATLPSVEQTDENAILPALSEVGDEPTFVSWVAKVTASSPTPVARLLVLGHYRAYIFKKAMFGSGRELRRSGHYYALSEVESCHTDALILKFEKEFTAHPYRFTLYGKGLGTEGVSVIQRQLSFYSHNFPPRYRPRWIVAPPSRRPEVDVAAAEATGDGGLAGGVIPAYRAFSNYYELLPDDALIAYLQELDERKETVLDLSRCGGGFRLKPLVAALKHNTYFTGIVVCDEPRETAVSAVAIALIRNATLTTVKVTNVGATAESFKNLGKVMRGNAQHTVTDLVLDGSFMGDAGAADLALGLSAPHTSLRTVSLRNGRVGARGSVAVLNALTSHEGGTARLATLALDRCDLSQAGTELSEVLRRAAPTLTSISLRSTGVNCGKLTSMLHESKLSTTLTSLDLSGSAKSIDVDSLGAVMASGRALKSLSLTHCGISALKATRILVAGSSNVSVVTGLHIDLSDNPLGGVPDAFEAFVEAIETASNGGFVDGFGLANTKLSTDEFSTICDTLTNGTNTASHLTICLDEGDGGASADLGPHGEPAPPSCTPAGGASGASGSGLSAPARVVAALTPRSRAAADSSGSRSTFTRSQILMRAVLKSTTLRSLRIRPSTKSAGMFVGKDMAPFLLSLKKGKLERLDVSGHRAGDVGIRALADLVKSSETLTHVAADGNVPSIGALDELRDAFAKNKSVVHFAPLTLDRQALYADKVNGRQHPYIRTLLNAIEDYTVRNRETAAAAEAAKAAKAPVADKSEKASKGSGKAAKEGKASKSSKKKGDGSKKDGEKKSSSKGKKGGKGKKKE